MNEPALRRGRTRPGIVLAVAAVGVFMAFVDDTVIGIAFPNIIHSFPGTSLSALSWVLNAYNIAFAALLIPMGRFADQFGRRIVYVTGIGLFTVGSALSAIAPSIGALIAARAVQGAGAAAIVPASLAIILDAYPSAKRAQAVGIWGATAALAAGIGPSIGGALVTLDSWRLVFAINIPIGIAGYVCSRRLLVESRAPGPRLSPDLGGAALLATAVGALTLAIVQGPDWGWTSPGVIGAAMASVLVAALLARRCLRRRSPIIDLELLRTPGFSVTGLLTLVGSAGFFAVGLLNVLFLIDVWHYSPLKAGLAITPTPFLAAVAAGAAGQLATRVDPRRLMLAGAAVWTVGPLLLFARAGPDPNYLGVYLPAAALLAIGVGIAFPLVSDAAVGVAPAGRYAGATALNGAIRQVGATIGVAILAAILGYAEGLTAVHYYRPGWLFAAGCFAFVAAGSLALTPFRAPDLADDEELARRRAAIAVGVDKQRDGLPRAREQIPKAPIADTDEALIADVSIFAELPPAARLEIAEQARIVHVAGGEWLFRQGDSADSMFVVRSGRLDVLLESDDRQPERINELGRGSVVGELALLGTGERSASVRGRRDTTLLQIDRETFASLLEAGSNAPAIARALGAQLQRSRRVDVEAPEGAKTLVIRHARSPRSAAIADELIELLGPICNAVVLGRERVADEELGAGLSRVLDRVERAHELVLLAAAGTSDEWTQACVRQADRVVLIVENDDFSRWAADASQHQERLDGCDVLLLDGADHPEILARLDRLGPRSTHRVRGSDDLRRLARRLAGRAVGLVLSGGGARALCHIGVIEELEAAGVTIDRIGGVSMGSFIGALLAQGLDAAEIDARCYREYVRRNPVSDFRIPRTSLIRGARARAMLERNLPGLIEDLPRSFYCASTDIISSELVVHRRGSLMAAVTASMSIPGVFAPVRLGRRLLVDGAVLDGLPITIMAADGEGPIIASDVSKPDQRTLAPGEEPPDVGLVDTLVRVMLLGRPDAGALAREHADLTITPNHEQIGQLEFHMLDRMRDAGRRAALTALESAPARLFG